MGILSDSTGGNLLATPYEGCEETPFTQATGRAFQLCRQRLVADTTVELMYLIDHLYVVYRTSASWLLGLVGDPPFAEVQLIQSGYHLMDTTV